MDNKRYLVTGGTGFIGSALVKRLVAKGKKVRVFDSHYRGNSDRLQNIVDKIEIVKGDIRSFKDVKKACKDIDAIFHLAYINGTEYFYSKPDLVLEVAVKGMTNLLDAAKDEQVKEFFLASSSEVYQSPLQIPTPETVPLFIPDVTNPRFSYGGGKMICELMALHWAAKQINRVIIFRPHNVYGPDMGYEHVIPQLTTKLQKLTVKDTKLPIQGTGKETRAFIYIDDFIDGLMLIEEKAESSSIYHIGSNEEISIASLVGKIAEYMGLSVECIPGPLQKGGTLRRCPDITKLQSLGFSLSTPLSEGIKKTVDWYMANPKATCCV